MFCNETDMAMYTHLYILKALIRPRRECKKAYVPSYTDCSQICVIGFGGRDVCFVLCFTSYTHLKTKNLEK